MTNDPEDRFGMPESAFRVAIESHGLGNPTIRVGMYVPNRREVAEMEPDLLHPVLIDWMWECPSELIPNNEQISAVKQLLLARPDAETDAIRSIVAACDDFLKV